MRNRSIGALSRARTRETRTYICGPMRRNGSALLHRCKADLLPRWWLAKDLDGGSREDCDVLLLRISAYRAVAWTTARHTPECPRIRILLALDRAVDGPEGARLGAAFARMVGAGLESLKWDRSTDNGEQACFLPMAGAAVMRYRGAPIDVDAVLATAPVEPSRDRPATADPYRALLIERGLLLRELAPGKDAITCPYASEHSPEPPGSRAGTDTSTIYLWPLFGGFRWGRIHCLHEHCAERQQAEFIQKLGADPRELWRAQAGAAPYDLPPVGSYDDAARESASGGQQWPEALPLSVKASPEPYPLDAHPEIVRNAVAEVQGFVKAPVALVAASALTAMSVAAQAHIDVRRANKLEGPSSLFMLPIADSGERKTTCDGFFTRVIRDYEGEEANKAKDKIQEYDARLRGWTAEREGIESAIRSASKSGKQGRASVLRRELVELEKEKPERPRVPKLLRMDDTPENLAWSLVMEWPSAGVISSEAGIVFGAHAMGRDSIMRNLALLNLLWDGGQLPIGRRTTESFTVRGVRLTVGLQIQEAALRSFFDRSDGLARGIGFLARFLVSWPESTQGFRPFDEAPENWPALAAFNRRIAQILAIEVPMGKDGALSPAMMVLAPDAKAAWVKFHDAIEIQLRSGGELYDVRDVASKTADNAVRLAALFQFFEHGMGSAIELDAFEGASRIVAWHLNESRRFFGELALPPELVDAARLDAWLIEYCRRERTQKVPTKKVQQFGPARLREKAKIEAAARVLEELDRVRLVLDGRRKEIHVNPALLA